MNKKFYALALLGLSFLGVNSVVALTNPFASKKAEVAGPQDNIDRVKFWGTVVTALKKSGYTDDSAEIRHAERYLHRAESAKGSKGGFMSRMFGTGGKKAATARTEKRVADRKTTARATAADRTKKTAAAKARAKRATTARTTARRTAKNV